MNDTPRTSRSYYGQPIPRSTGLHPDPMTDDAVFWLSDAASVLRNNGTVQHAEHIQRSIGTITQLRADLAAMTAERDRLREALKLVEAVYRKNCVAPGEPSSVLAAMQAALASEAT